MQFEMAVLYGRFAGGRMRSELEGYELLLITQDDPEMEGWQLEEYMKTEYPTESRSERMLHIETVNIYHLNTTNTASWFFWNIRMEGTIVYDSGNAVHGFFNNTVFRHVKAWRAARKFYDYFFTNGSRMLDEAERLWAEKQLPQVAIMLSHAALFLLRAQETVFFGNFIHTANLLKIFRRVRHFSKALVKEFRLKNRFDAEFFEKLTRLRSAPSNHEDFVLPRAQYRYYLTRLRKMQQLVQISCERHLFYLEHGKTRNEWMNMNRLDAQAAEPAEEAAAPAAEAALPAEANCESENTGREGSLRQITVEVNPIIALTALGLAKEWFPSILERSEAQSGLRMDEGRKRQMLDTLNEMYERCIEQTDIREVANLYLRSELTGKIG